MWVHHVSFLLRAYSRQARLSVWPLCRPLPHCTQYSEGGGTRTPSFTGTTQGTHICQPDRTRDNRKSRLSWEIGAEMSPYRHSASKSSGKPCSSGRASPPSIRPAVLMGPLHRDIFPEELASGLPCLLTDTWPRWPVSHTICPCVRLSWSA